MHCSKVSQVLQSVRGLDGDRADLAFGVDQYWIRQDGPQFFLDRQSSRAKWGAFGRTKTSQSEQQERGFVGGELQRRQPEAVAQLVAAAGSWERDYWHTELRQRADIAQDRAPRYLEPRRELGGRFAPTLQGQQDPGQ